MRITPKIAAFAVAGLALAAPGAAMAASHGAAHQVSASHSVAASSEPTGPDHDSLQQGDQTSPDSASGTARTASTESAGPDHDSLQQGDQTSPDTASGPAKAATVKATSPTPEPSSPEGESAAESESTVSDGPGGHADASGNVQYEFNGVQ